MMAKLEEVKNEGRVVRLSVNPTVVNQTCAETHHGWTLSNLLPGLLVQACIKKVTQEIISRFSDPNLSGIIPGTPAALVWFQTYFILSNPGALH